MTPQPGRRVHGSLCTDGSMDAVVVTPIKVCSGSFGCVVVGGGDSGKEWIEGLWKFGVEGQQK
jgi:hypothetical protein